MFRLSKITDYGIVLLAHLAGQPSHELHNARELAQEVDLPLPVVSKILKSLARRGILDSHRGSKGGYSLRHPPEHMTVAEMIDALEGPVALTDCTSQAPGGCQIEGHCRVRDPWQVINRTVHDALSQITLADLIRQDFPTALHLYAGLRGDAPLRDGSQSGELSTPKVYEIQPPKRTQ